MASPRAAKRARSENERKGVLVLDFGSQYTQLITRRVREIGVYSVLVPGDVTKPTKISRFAHCCSKLLVGSCYALVASSLAPISIRHVFRFVTTNGL
eukprot:2459849-Pyramimonas_sp.AAC.1